MFYYSNTLFDLRKIDFGMYAKCIDTVVDSFSWVRQTIVKIDSLGNEVYVMIMVTTISMSTFMSVSFTPPTNHFYYTCNYMDTNRVICGGINKSTTPFKAFTQKSYGQ